MVTELNDWLSFAQAFYSVGIFVFGVVLRELLIYIKHHKIRSVLSAGRKKYFAISIPAYRSEINTGVDDYVLKKEVALRQSITSFLEEAALSTRDPDNPRHDNEFNEIHIGSPIANTKTGTYIKNHFPQFKQYVSSAFIAAVAPENLDSKYGQTYEVNDQRQGFKCGDGERPFLEYIRKEQDYALVIKLTARDLQKNKAVHLLFGAGRSGTQAAVNYLIDYHGDLYKKFKGKHYFVALPVNKDGSVNMSKMDDLTEVMFRND